MSISMYSVSVPGMSHSLKNLAAILKKAAAHAKAKNIDPAVLVRSRLYPDMLPLVQQVQIAADTAKGAAARLAGREPPKFEDTESTFPELIERVNKTLAYLRTVKRTEIEGSEDRDIILKFPSITLEFKGLDYLTGFAIPNFYFHVATAYDILRHNGVEIGKRDFLGSPPKQGGKKAAKGRSRVKK